MLFFQTSPLWETRSYQQGKSHLLDYQRCYFLVFPSGTCEILFNLETILRHYQGESHAWSQKPEHNQLSYGWALAVLQALKAQNKYLQYFSDQTGTIRPHNSLYMFSSREKCCTHQWTLSKTDCFCGRDLGKWLHVLIHPGHQEFEFTVKLPLQHLTCNSCYLQISWD